MISVNLLARKERKSTAPLLAFLVFCLCLFLISLYFYFTTQSLTKKIDQNVSQFEMLNQKLMELNNGGPGGEEAKSLENAIATLEVYDPMTVDMLGKMVPLLPKNGYLLNLQFERNSSLLNFTLETKNYLESGEYVTNLLDQEWVKSAKISSILLNTTPGKDSYTSQVQVEVEKETWKSKKGGEQK